MPMSTGLLPESSLGSGPCTAPRRMAERTNSQAFRIRVVGRW